MAKLKYNVVMHGVSGIVGDLLEFRQRYGKTIIAKIGQRSKPPSVNQQLVKEKFSRAVLYAKSALKNPTIKEIYKLKAEGGITPYNNALKDFFTPPVIVAVNTEGYSGAIGNPILVSATDDTKVTKVGIQVFDINGNLVEAGAAVQLDDDGDWMYTATVSNADPAGGRIVVEAQDLPRNTTTQEVLL